MVRPHLVLSEYKSITDALGNLWGHKSGNRGLFSFTNTYAKTWSGPQVRNAMDCGMDSYWIYERGKRSSETVYLVICDLSYSDWSHKTGMGAAYFLRGMILDPCYGTLPIHPIGFPENIYKDRWIGLDDFMSNSSPEIQDFVIKNILFNVVS